MSATSNTSASELIDARIAELGDWRGPTLARVRSLIKQAVLDIVEEWKWRGVPVWSHAGYRLHRRDLQIGREGDPLAKGAALAEPAGLFNASLDGNTRRAIDLREGETIDEAAFIALGSRRRRLERRGPCQAEV